MEKKKIEDIKKEVEREFPDDFALQQVHIARKVLTEESKEKKMSFCARSTRNSCTAGANNKVIPFFLVTHLLCGRESFQLSVR